MRIYSLYIIAALCCIQSLQSMDDWATLKDDWATLKKELEIMKQKYHTFIAPVKNLPQNEQHNALMSHSKKVNNNFSDEEHTIFVQNTLLIPEKIQTIETYIKGQIELQSKINTLEKKVNQLCK